MDSVELIVNNMRGNDSSEFEIKGLNFNGNYELTDSSLRIIVDFV